MATALARATCHDELLEGLKLRKAALALSDAVVDETAGLAQGHTSKILNRERGTSSATLWAILDTLALDIVLVPSQEKLARLKDVARRNSQWAHPNRRVSKTLIARALPAVMRNIGAKGVESMRARGTLAATVKRAGKARQASMTKAQRRELARIAAQARWKKRNDMLAHMARMRGLAAAKNAPEAAA